MEKSISLDGIRMRVVSTAEGGDVNTETIFEFAQTIWLSLRDIPVVRCGLAI